VGDELVGQDRGIHLDLDDIDGEGGHLGLDDAPNRVGEGEVGFRHVEVHLELAGLWQVSSWLSSASPERPSGSCEEPTDDILTDGPACSPSSARGS